MKTAKQIILYAVWLTGLAAYCNATAQSKLSENNSAQGCPCFTELIQCLTGNMQDGKPLTDKATLNSILAAYSFNGNQGQGNSANGGGGCNSNNNGWDNAINTGNAPPAVICIAEYIACCEENGCR